MNAPTSTYATGRRKESVARVYISPGKGQIHINNKPLDLYFPDPRDQQTILKVLEVTEKQTTYDIYVFVQGGGLTGQKEAIRHGISRVIVTLDPDARPTLKKMNYLTRDARSVLPKRYGKKKHRKLGQFSKR